jgi:N-acetyl-anhydromuramyl-L-alanine amidase AmpD
MMRTTFFLFLTLSVLLLHAEPTRFVCEGKPLPTFKIINKPIKFGANRIAMTKAYIQTRYGKRVNNIRIVPQIIVIHWTALMSLENSFRRFYPEKLLSDRHDIASASALNVSAHFLVDRDGTIYQMMPDNYMARHVIGLNYSSIGIENVGGAGNRRDDLTQAQRIANVKLIRYLRNKYPTIQYLIGHHEYRRMERTSLWLERDRGYRTIKADPGERFMAKLRQDTADLLLKAPPR